MPKPVAAAPSTPFMSRTIVGIPVRAFTVGLVAALVLAPVALFLAGLGIAVLQISGGAARDTGIAVAVAAICVTDFWGGSLVWNATRITAREVACTWLAVRAVILFVILVTAPKLVVGVLALLVLAGPAAWLGARVAAKQAALHGRARRQPRRARAAQ